MSAPVKAKSAMTSLRLPEAWLERADALAPTVALSRYAPTATGELRRSDVLRIALLRGLELLEGEAATTKRARDLARRAR